MCEKHVNFEIKFQNLQVFKVCIKILKNELFKNFMSLDSYFQKFE